MRKSLSKLVRQLEAVLDGNLDADVAEALLVLSRKKKFSTLFPGGRNTPAKLASTNSNRQKQTTPLPSPKASPPQSKVVAALKEVDPQKYEVLLEFEGLLRRGKLYESLPDLRTFADRLQKGFPRLKSRSEVISKLMAILAELPIEQITQIVGEAMQSQERTTDDYQRLARFLIRGGGGKEKNESSE